jgi:hypothetical protein
MTKALPKLFAAVLNAWLTLPEISYFEKNAKAQNSGDPELFQRKAPFSRESEVANAEGVRVSLNNLSKRDSYLVRRCCGSLASSRSVGEKRAGGVSP